MLFIARLLATTVPSITEWPSLLIHLPPIHTHKKEKKTPQQSPQKREEWGKTMMVHWSECEWTVSQRLWEIKSRQILNELRDKGWREMKRRRSGSVSMPRDCLTTLTDAVFWPQEGHCSQGLTKSWLVTQICTVASSESSLYSCQNWDYFDSKQTTLERKYEQQRTVNNSKQTCTIEHYLLI